MSQQSDLHKKQIQSKVLPLDHEYDLQIEFKHKEDGIANAVALTFEQVAMLKHTCDETLEIVDEDYQIKETVLNELPDEADSMRGFE